VQQQIRTRMMIKFPDHHPEDPYPIKDVRAAARFLLPGNSSVVPLPTTTQAQGPSPSPRNIAPQAPIYQQPAGGAVVKQEYHASRSGAYSAQGCMFCGSKEHYLSRCHDKIAYIKAGKCKMIEHTQKLVLPDGRWIPGKPQEGSLKERLDRYHTNQQVNEALPNASVTAGIFVRAEPEVGAIVEVDSSAFVHTIADASSEVDEDELEVERAVQALALATAKRDQKKAGSASSSKGRNMRFDGVEMSSGSRTRPGPASRQLADAEEIVSPAVQVTSGKGKAQEIAKAPSASTTSASKSKEAAKAPSVASTIESASSTATSSSSSSMQYRYSFALEDKDADKRVVQRLLECNINMPVRELFAVSPDVRKQFRDLTTTKRVTVGTVSVNELSSQQTTEEFMRAFDQDRLRSDDGKVVADHFAPLRCIRAVTIGGRVLTCVLDQGAEVVVMPKEVWRSLGVGLRADHTLNMESVNTTKDATLGVVENVPLDFGAGPMFFQVQVTERANFEILLGRPFFKLTACKTFDLPNGDQDILLTDPNTRKELRLPTQQWVKRCGCCVSGLPCPQHAPKPRVEEEMEENVKVVLKGNGSKGLRPQLVRCAPFPSIAPYFRML